MINSNFENKFFEEGYRRDEGGRPISNHEKIKRMEKSLEEMTADDVLFMSNAILRDVGSMSYCAATPSIPKDGGPTPDMQDVSYVNLPKNSFTIFARSKNYEFSDHIKEIIKFYDGKKTGYFDNPQYTILRSIRSFVNTPMPFTSMTIKNEETAFDNGRKIFFEYFYTKDTGHVIHKFEKGPWLADLTETYNAVVKLNTIKHKGMESYCLMKDYWSKPKHIAVDD